MSALFRTAREHAPCVLLLDELQALFGGRRGGGTDGGGHSHGQMLSQLLVELDALSSSSASSPLIVVGVTTSPQHLDGALLRPGRLEHSLYIGPPSARTRTRMLEAHLFRMPIEGGREAATALADGFALRTFGFTGADLESLCQRAALAALQRVDAAAGGAGTSGIGSLQVAAADLEAALLAAPSPSVAAAQIAGFELWRRGHAPVF